MGYSVPAAMGVQAGHLGEPVWVVVGMGLPDEHAGLATIAQERLPIKYSSEQRFSGMVRQWQEMFHEARYIGTPISAPDFVRLASSFGIRDAASLPPSSWQVP